MSSFCTNCGGRLNDNGVCQNCGAVYTFDGQPQDEIFVDANGVYVDANGNPIPPEQFQPVDLSGYYTQPNDGYVQQNYQPNAGYPQQNYQPNAGYPQQNYQTDAGYPQQDYQPNAGYPQQNYSQPKTFKMPAIITEWLGCAKSFFTQEPSNVIDEAIGETNHSWVIFAGLNAFFAALCVSGIVGSILNNIIEKMLGAFASYLMDLTDASGFGQMFLLFFISLISFAVLFFAASMCEYVFLSVVKKKVEFEDLFKAVAISYFPMTIACAAAFIFSLFLLPMSFILIIAGFIAGFMLLNESLKKLAGELPFWGVVLSNIVQVVVTIIIIYAALSIVM
ncbi:MAG: hypothetical protein PUB37_09575 [Firmicutes bacterium]|nr:hypothetical protein [Bacillota bacterium]